ncbi:AAA family ATPase [Candidatus Contubernalis alkaliaceticus]|uniref:AAA family ATPase n=1 Tax=Candidatus Contubernalis alkaliaceticus TaxID=338645 RepID=UPI001F4C3AFA|nr:AAA family ATPase [Candidatus Contubernalis alkalaceticus]UNC93227.1 AAA family ATPase [Candidatus Contubernalis alkalaceticus]
MLTSDCYLREVSLKRELLNSYNDYSFSLPAVQLLNHLEFHPAVTFIIGENGTGKSTLLEALAAAVGFNPEGGSKNFNFSTRETHSKLHDYIKIVRGFKHMKDGYFLRAESFYNVATSIDELEITDYYGDISLHEQSHGEGFMTLFIQRFGGKGLYILDEPEAALSPSRQMALVARIHELVKQESQFVISTHSPIIMAYPHAKIYQLSEEGYSEVHYKETEHYRVTRNFLKDTERFLKYLLEE